MRRSFWFALIVLLLALGLVVRHNLKLERHWGATELVLAPAVAWTNVTPLQRQGFGALFRDCLEFSGGLALVEPEAVLDLREVTLDTLQVRVTRQGDLIQIHLLRKRQGQPDRHVQTGFEAPVKAVASALAALELDEEVARLMIPKGPETFWRLAELADRRVEDNLGPALDAAVAVVDQEPECASAWLAKARIGELYLLTNITAEPELQQQCDGDFLRALELAPDYPRAVIAAARFKTDIGNQRAALETLFTALKRYPRVPRLYEAIAYAARTCGLLEEAKLALKQRDQLLGLSCGEAGLTENTYLYLGDLTTFEAVLGENPGASIDPYREFYRGYARLVRGDRAGAGRHFARAHEQPRGIPQFEQLAEIYDLGVQGRKDEALALLRRLWVTRVPLRVPDGEYTFKLAEAFGFLGSRGEAQDAASRAFAQGFGCTRWYQQSPFLAGIRGTPRWNALEQHLQDRQRLTQQAFPVSRFRF